jgi:hypothetical protein
MEPGHWVQFGSNLHGHVVTQVILGLKDRINLYFSAAIHPLHSPCTMPPPMVKERGR